MMASDLPTQTAEDNSLMRLRCMYANVVTRVLQFVFESGTSDRPSCMPLLQYYSSNGDVISSLKGELYARQIEKIEHDPGGKSFDIPLLVTCLRNGSHRLTGDSDNGSLESLIMSLKKKIGVITLEELVYSNQQLISETQELRDLLTRILNLAGQLYKIPSATIDQETSNIESSINKYLHDDLVPKDFEEYKEKLLFPTLSELVNKEGVEDVLEHYDRNNEGMIRIERSGHHKAAINIPVGVLFTDVDLVIQSASGQEKAISYENLLQDENENEDDTFILIHGVAGVGKTTLIKRLLSDWRSGESLMKHLGTYDVVLKCDCGNRDISSFREMLQQLMARVAGNFKDNDLEKVTVAQKVLLILDGLDELNESSASLFGEVLQLKRDFGIRIIVASRPEKVEYCKQQVSAFNFSVKDVRLLGMSSERREEFITKYHREISKKYSDVQTVDGLLSFVRQTEHPLSYMWNIPFNLASLTVLWSFNVLNISNIIMPPKLCWELHKLYRSKLAERLQDYRAILNKSKGWVDKVIDLFVLSLAEESLISLKDDQEYLSHEAYLRLEEICSFGMVPIDPMISAFLEKVPSSSVAAYGFRHKAVQCFLAAYYIWMEIIPSNQSCDAQIIMDSLTDVLSKKAVPVDVMQSVLKATRNNLKDDNPLKTTNKGCTFVLRYVWKSFKELLSKNAPSTAIRDILKKIHGSAKYDISKYLGMLSSLVGLIHLEGEEIEVKVKLEAHNLFYDSVNLNCTRYDVLAPLFISKQPKVLEGNIQITDSSIFAYLSLMKALKLPLRDAPKVNIHVDIKGDIAGVDELLTLVSIHKFRIRSIAINDNNMCQYTSVLKMLQKSLKEPKEVAIDVDVNKDLSSITELMVQIKKKGFIVRTLKLKEEQISVDDTNLDKYTSALKSLPTLLKGAFKGTIKIDITRETSDFSELLREISRNKLAVEISHHHSFRHPAAKRRVSDHIMNEVFQRCEVKVYRGSLTPKMSLPKTIRDLSVSVADESSYFNLELFLQSNPNLDSLDICMTQDINPSVLASLPEPSKGLPRLFLPDITALTDVDSVCQMIKNLQPGEEKTEFQWMYFPRCRLSQHGIERLLHQMKGTGTTIVAFPTNCKPSSPEEVNRIQELAGEEFKCKDRVHWGSSGTIDVDLWEN